MYQCAHLPSVRTVVIAPPPKSQYQRSSRTGPYRTSVRHRTQNVSSPVSRAPPRPDVRVRSVVLIPVSPIIVTWPPPRRSSLGVRIVLPLRCCMPVCTPLRFPNRPSSGSSSPAYASPASRSTRLCRPHRVDGDRHVPVVRRPMTTHPRPSVQHLPVIQVVCSRRRELALAQAMRSYTSHTPRSRSPTRPSAHQVLASLAVPMALFGFDRCPQIRP